MPGIWGRSPRLAALAVLLTLLVARPAGAGGDPVPWLTYAVERLKTLGVLPLWTGVARPSSRADLRAAIAQGEAGALLSGLSPADRALLARIRQGAGGAPSVAAGTLGAELGLSYGFGLLTGARQGVEWSLGWLTSSYVAAARGQGGNLAFLAGRERIGWGPSAAGGLLFSEAAGGLDRLEVGFTWRHVRFTRFLAWPDAAHSLVGSRLDLSFGRRFRLGIGEAILIQGGPYLPYVLSPMPMLLNQYLQQRYRQPAGFDDNPLVTIDAEWLVRPGLRLFGELLIDDYTVPTPTANFPSRWGLTVGAHTVLARSGGDLLVQYTRVPNWTYSTVNPAQHYQLRGLPLGHPLGADFDLLHLRWHRPGGRPLVVWGSFIRKGEGRVGQIWASEAEAREFVFLRDVVEQSFVVGFEAALDQAGWSGTIGPWVAYRINAGHVPGVTRVDWGISLGVSRTF